MSRILLVEDETILGDTIVLSLQKLGFECVWVKTLHTARAALRQGKFDFWILDRNLPDGDGLILLSEKNRKNSMVLVLSAKSSVDEKVEGLQAGADDYLQKPFSYQELQARLHALARRKPEAEPEVENALWKLDADQLQVLAPTGWVTLTPLEFKFLSYLVDRSDAIVSKDRLLREVWGFSLLPKTRTVDYLITQLRKRIEPEPDKPQHLLTVRGAGVKFVK